MAIDEFRVERLEESVDRNNERLNGLETRESARDVKVKLAMDAMNRQSTTTGALAVALVGAVIAFILTGGSQ